MWKVGLLPRSSVFLVSTIFLGISGCVIFIKIETFISAMRTVAVGRLCYG